MVNNFDIYIAYKNSFYTIFNRKRLKSLEVGVRIEFSTILVWLANAQRCFVTVDTIFDKCLLKNVKAKKRRRFSRNVCDKWPTSSKNQFFTFSRTSKLLFCIFEKFTNPTRFAVWPFACRSINKGKIKNNFIGFFHLLINVLIKLFSPSDSFAAGNQ